MQYDVSFGRIDRTRRAPPGPAFRLAVLGDFSGRASAGTLDTGDALAKRKPLKVDVDNLDDVLARLAPKIIVPLGDEGTVEIAINAMDDFHPDQLVESLSVFEQLLTLRRNVQSKAGFDRALKEIMGWAGAEPLPPPESRRPRGGAVAVDRKIGDFARLTGRKPAAEADADELVRRLVGPYIVPARDSRQDTLLARVDEALSGAMRRILHSPEFQSAEALWRGLEMLVRGLETGAKLQIVLFDITAEEFAADLAANQDLKQSALYSLLVEQPAGDADAGPFSLVAALYGFELAPPHADLLGRAALLGAAAGTPVVTAIGPDALLTPQHEWHPLVRSAWAALRALPASVYLALATPRFLLRMPYGKKSDPIDAFAFEEFSRSSGLSGMLWGNPAVLLALLAGRAWSKKPAAMELGAVNVVGELPIYIYTDKDGDQIALPCTERMFSERQAATIASTGVIPLVTLRGRPEVRVSGFLSVIGEPLAGRWHPVEVDLNARTSAPKKPKVEGEEESSDSPERDPQNSSDGYYPAVEPEPEVTAEPEQTPQESESDLDALLASLGEEPPAAAEGETESDLDALLASLS